jgi:hypothetical protein
VLGPSQAADKTRENNSEKSPNSQETETNALNQPIEKVIVDLQPELNAYRAQIAVQIAVPMTVLAAVNRLPWNK